MKLMFVFFLNLIISCWTDLSKQTVFDECVSQCLAAVSAVKLISCRRATSAGLPESCAECILITKPCSRIYNMSRIYTTTPVCLHCVCHAQPFNVTDNESVISVFNLDAMKSSKICPRGDSDYREL